MPRVSALAAMIGCAPDTATTPVDPGTLPPIRLETVGDVGEKSNDQGRLKVEVVVPAGAVSLQATADSEVFVTVDEVIDPEGNTVLLADDWLGRDENLTSAFSPQRQMTVFDWPIRESDDPLVPGPWTVVWRTTNSSLSPVPQIRANVLTQVKHDPDLATGTIAVQIVWAEAVARERGVEDAVVEAVERWREVWAGAGITLLERYRNSQLDPRLGFVIEGDEDVADVAGTRAEGELQLVIGESVLGEATLFGISAGIPGTVQSTPFTFVAISWLSHAGPDGEFDANEIRLMGETMAHETGHYTGLFHPVEAYYDAWDALGDTDHCGGFGDCNDALGHNVMFPYPLCDGSGCAPQGIVTEQQAGVLHRYVGAL